MSLPAILYDNRFDDGIQTASTTASDFDVANIEDWMPFTLWKGTGTADQFITVDCGSARSADSLGIIGHDLFSQNAAISVEYSTDNAVWNIAATYSSGVDFLSNTLIYKEFATQSARYWRLKIATGYTAAPFIGVLVIGARMQFPNGFENNGSFDPDSYSIKTTSQISQNGNLLGKALSHKNIKLNVNWLYIPTSFVDGVLKTFIDTHGLKPFFWIWDYSGHPVQVYFVSLLPDFQKSFPFSSGTSLRNVKLSFSGVLE